ncbi:hypothetical protein [Aquabacterium sp.]|uniref:hypothetical protein n=1 Tax=Aquabacterium sp. TaxID=1872578 RepID=UPI002BA874F5|nr:hypothetical protein [Aquabacterium sp.]HSW03835.1 hypothetical protein [Aquabacterium sp.]
MKKALFIASLGIALSGCATIMGSPTQTIPISSTPSEAKIVITDEAGTEVFAGTTPTSVTLNKSSGRYWGGKSFTVAISKPGFKTQTIPVASRPNGWYIGGNFVFGGLIGWFAVDPLSGNMYTLSPEAVAAAMPTDTAHNNRSTDGSIAILLLQDVPANLRGKLVQIH